jgi:hypothetical protein
VARTLLIDEDLDPRLAAQLRSRGRHAFNAEEVGTKGRADEAVLRHLAKLGYEWALVTADDSMPLEHATVIRDIDATIATVDGAKKKLWHARGILRQDEFDCETVHRWAHKMADMPGGTIRRFSPNDHQMWTRRRR